MKSSILYFFLLILRVPFNLALDIIYKHNIFSKTLLKKGLEFDSNRKNGLIIFLLYFILLLSKINPISKEQNCKKNAFRVYDLNNFEIVFRLLAEIIIFYMQMFIIKIGILGFK